MREIARLAWPIAVSMLSYSAMTLVGTLFVAGSSGRSALAGVGLGGIAAMTLICFSIGLLRAVKTLVSQAVGAGRPGEAAAYRSAGLTLALALGAAAFAIGELVAPLLAHIASSPAAGHAARVYLAIRMLEAPLVHCFVALREARYGEGDPRTPMLASLLSNGLNIGFDYLFVVVLHGGAAGAASGALCATAIGVTALWLASGRPRPAPLARTPHLLAVWRIGIPTGVQFLLEVGAFSLLTMLVAAMPEADMAAHQIVIQVIHFSFLPALAIGEAASVLAGQAVGARREELVHSVARHGLAVAAIYTGACTLLFIIIGPWVLAHVASDAEVARTAVSLLWIAAVFQIADGVNAVTRGVLRGAGDVRAPAVLGVITSWLCLPPLTGLFGYVLHWGVRGAWLAMCVEIFAGALLFWFRLERGGWRPAAAAARAELIDIEISPPGYVGET
ncbi:MAG TPA: MATE family efflux transporter [Kofleriaceae bacterium]|nr:MATE family efflux transporter [Kofleriaceae bacterium]